MSTWSESVITTRDMFRPSRSYSHPQLLFWLLEIACR